MTLTVKKKDYQFNKTLGEGTFGIVRSALWKAADPPINVAVKVISKKILKGHDEIVKDEMNVLKGLDQPHVVKFLDWFESKDKVRHAPVLLHLLSAIVTHLAYGHFASTVLPYL